MYQAMTKLLRIRMCCLTALGLLTSCASDPPPPPPPGPESYISRGEEDFKYEGEVEEMVEPAPYIYEPDELVEAYPGNRSRPETQEWIDEMPPVSEEIDYGGIEQEGDMGDAGDMIPQELPAVSDDIVFGFVEQVPVYPGGDQAFLADLRNAIIYPEMERENFIRGKVYLKYIVERDGSISNVEIARGVPGGPGLGREAVRALKSLTKRYVPAKQNGKPVRYAMTVPVDFHLE